MTRHLIDFLFLTLLLPCAIGAQTFDTKKLMEDYSLQLFENNAAGFMGPLVIVANVGANDGFFNSAYVPKENSWRFSFAIKTMMAWVRDDQRTYTGSLPLTYDPSRDDAQMYLFKTLLSNAAAIGQLQPRVTSATVFGSEGEYFKIPKNYIRSVLPGIDTLVLRGIPDSIKLTNGTNQTFVFAAVPQLTIGNFMNTQVIARYIPAIKYDTAVGNFAFTGVAIKHCFTNWIPGSPFNAAVEVSFQHSTIENEVGATRAKLAATTDMWSVNVHASRLFFNWLEPYVGLSLENLRSRGSYTFTLPKTVVDQIGYDITPQVARIKLEDTAVKATVGATAHLGPVQINAGAGISKQFILGAGIAIDFGIPGLSK